MSAIVEEAADYEPVKVLITLVSAIPMHQSYISVSSLIRC